MKSGRMHRNHSEYRAMVQVRASASAASAETVTAMAMAAVLHALIILRIIMAV